MFMHAIEKEEEGGVDAEKHFDLCKFPKVR